MNLFYLIQMTSRNKENARSIHTVQQLSPANRPINRRDFISAAISKPRIYPTMRSTKAASRRATSRLNASTSSQQFNGRRSFNCRQLVTSDRALATPSSSSVSFLRPSSLLRSCSISAATESREMSRLAGCAGAAVSGADVGTGSW